MSLFLFGPQIIHAAYRMNTPDAVIQKQRIEYSHLEDSELQLTGQGRIASQKARHKLFLWFHARGCSIDEGDREVPLWHPWKELIQYWSFGDGF